MTEFIMPHMPSPNASLLFSFQFLVYHQTHGIYDATYIGGGAIFLVGGSSCETKIAEGIKDAKNRRFVLYIAFAAKSGGLQCPPPQLCPHHIWITCFLFISTVTLCQTAFFVQISCLSFIKHRSVTFVQLGRYILPELDLKIIRGIVNMGIKDYSQLIDIVNFCGKQHNISSSKKYMALMIYCQW